MNIKSSTLGYQNSRLISDKSPESFGTPNCNFCHHQKICIANKFLEADPDVDVQEVVIDKGNDIITNDNDEEFVYFLKSGSVQESIQYEKQPLIISEFRFPWSIFGAHCDSKTDYNFYYTALERTRLCRISKSTLRQISLSRPDLIFDLQKRSFEISENGKLFLAIIRNKTAMGKVAYFLIHLYKNKNPNSVDTKELLLTMPRSSISRFLGLSIEGVSRVLTKLNSVDIIEVFNRRITVKDIQQLEVISLSKSEL